MLGNTKTSEQDQPKQIYIFIRFLLFRFLLHTDKHTHLTHDVSLSSAFLPWWHKSIWPKCQPGLVMERLKWGWRYGEFSTHSPVLHSPHTQTRSVFQSPQVSMSHLVHFCAKSMPNLMWFIWTTAELKQACSSSVASVKYQESQAMMGKVHKIQLAKRQTISTKKLTNVIMRCTMYRHRTKRKQRREDYWVKNIFVVIYKWLLFQLKKHHPNVALLRNQHTGAGNRGRRTTLCNEFMSYLNIIAHFWHYINNI